MKKENLLLIGKESSVIESNQFSNNKEIVDIIISKSVEKIGSGAFYNCPNLRSVRFEEDSKFMYLEDSAFQNCKNLETFDFPKNMVYIHAHAFWDCMKLPSELVLPSNLQYIEATAFFNTNVKKVVLSSNCKYQSIDKDFPYEPSFPETADIQGGVPYDFYSNLSYPLPSIEFSDTDIIQSNQYSERHDLESVVISRDIQKIGSSAFYFCSNLKNIKFEDNSNLKSIDYFAFQNCFSLKSIVFPEGLVEIKAHSFWACSNLENVIFPNSLKAIDASAFYTTKLLKVVLPSNCYYQAKGHGFPYEASFPENCEVVGGIPFDFYKDRPFPVPPYKINILESKKNVFDHSKYIVPEGSVEIESNQFSGRTDLESIVIPKSVQVIRPGAFYLCKNLKEVKFENGSSLKSIEHYAFQNCFKLERINFPSKLEQLRAHSFWCCSSLKQVFIPKSLKIIDASVFYTTSIKEIDLPSSCKYQGIRHGFPHELSFPPNCKIKGGIALDLYQ